MTTYNLSVSGGPTGGSFQLAITTGPVGGGQTYSASIPFNATAQNVKDLLEALPNLAKDSVKATGGALPATPVALQFEGHTKGVPRLVAIGTNSLTGGTTPTPAVSEDTSVRYDKPGRNDKGSVATFSSAGAFGT